MESSHRDLLNDVAEHWSILKNSQNAYYPLFSFTYKTGISFPETGVLFLLRARFLSQNICSPLFWRVSTKCIFFIVANNVIVISL